MTYLTKPGSLCSICTFHATGYSLATIGTPAPIPFSIVRYKPPETFLMVQPLPRGANSHCERCLTNRGSPPAARTLTHLLVALPMVLIANYGFAINLVEIHGCSQKVVFDFVDPRFDGGRTTRRSDERHSIFNMRESGIDRLRRGVVQGRRTTGVRARWARGWWVRLLVDCLEWGGVVRRCVWGSEADRSLECCSWDGGCLGGRVSS